MMIAYQQRLRDDFSSAAPEYDRHASLQKEVTHELAKWTRPRMQPGSRWLDAGCGTGALARWMRASLPPAVSLWQIDCAENMCHMAAPLATRTLCADLRQLPLGDASVDGVFTSLALQWALPPQSAMAELRRVTRSGGTLAFSTLVPGTLAELEQAFQRLRQPSRLHEFHDALHWQSALETSGWRMEAERHKRMVLRFPQPRDVLDHLRGLGATRKRDLKPLTQHMLRRLLEAYPCAKDGSAPATYEIWMGLATAV